MPTILVVDDDPAHLTFVRNALRDESCSVEATPDAEGALEFLDTNSADLLILDLNLPGKDGYEVLEAVRRHDEQQFVLIVLLSATDDLEAKVRGLDMGAIDYLVKPVHPEELAARVRTLLRIKQRGDDIYSEYARLSQLSLTDPLTDAYNRRALDRLLQARLAESARHREPVSCLMFDIDHFKDVNDNHGHQVGDIVLREIAGLAHDQCRQEDALVRYGGEEFLVILVHAEKKGACVFGERFREKVAAHVFAEDTHPVRITISAGVATHPEDNGAKDVEGMIATVDRRLYAAKNAGRNRVMCSDGPPPPS
ncbi:MAG: diguanylate cyclase [Candidatus Latescibacteria bacterium]|nr:diguanylate cyclase [Candidatus Latescibacterota bacterium]